MGHETNAVAGRLLLVDDEPDLLSGLRLYFKRRRFEVLTAGSAEEALERLETEPVDLVLTDLMLPGMGGLELLRELRQGWPQALVVLMTGYATVETAVAAIRDGAFDYVTKPFTPQQVEVVLQRALEHRTLTDENRRLKVQLKERFAFRRLVGFSDAMRQVQALLSRIAGTEANVLVVGESGTGKELVAKAIHENSRRSERPFIPLDCAAIPQNLMEAELFGYEKGAFTGATSSHAGLLEAAHTGTFFMDELGELDMSLQVKLLRVLQERQFRRVGGMKMITVDVRFVAATNRDLEQEVRAGRFREDLYHRLNVIQLRLPPLRERRGDVSLLAQQFLQESAQRHGRTGLRWSPAALQVLEAYTWPGNVRELQNAVEYAVSISDQLEIGVEELPHQLRCLAGVRADPGSLPADSGGPENTARGLLLGERGEVLEVHYDLPYKEAKRRWLETFEREYFGELLRRHEYNISHTARAAEVDRKSIQRILKKNNLDIGSLIEDE